MKRSYVSPSITTEKIEIGVFGSYGGSGNNGSNHGWGDHTAGNGNGHNNGRGHKKRFFGLF